MQEAVSIEEPEVTQEGYDGLAKILADSRREAIEGRHSSGIEQVWDEDESHYQGVDEFNEDPTWNKKPPGRDEVKTEQINQSTAFANITRPYCDAAGARIGDMLVPTDDKSFSFDNTPIPDSLAISKGEFPEDIRNQITQAYPDNPEQAQTVMDQAVDQEKKIVDEAKKKAKKAEKRVEDWLIECQYHSHMREVIDDCAKSGSGVLKGPIPNNRVGLAYKDGQLTREEKVAPSSIRINYRNFFPDPNCGESIHRGSYTWERDDITERELYGLMGGDYFDDQIRLALEEGAHEAVLSYTEENHGLKLRDKKNLFEIWYYYGMVGKKDLERIGIIIEEMYLHVHVVMVNNRVIKVVESHLDTGEFPYDVMVWQKRADSPWGIGVSRQIRVPQKILNGALRMLMDNAGLSGKPMWIVLRGLVEPLDGTWDIYAGKGWGAGEDADMDDVRKAFQFVVPPMMLQEMKLLVELAMKMAEDITGLPFLLQGQQGQAPDTVGGMQLMNSNASTVLRRLARLYDDRVTEPHVRRYYNYLLQYGEDSEKGDFQIDARGSSALVEREIQNQFILNMGQYVLNPVFKKDPAKWINEAMKGQRLDPKTLDYDDEKWEQTVQQILSAGQSDSRIQVEQMRQEGKQAEMQFKAQMTEREQQFEAQMKEMDRQYEMAIKQIEIENDQRKEVGKAELTAAEIQRKLQEARDRINSEIAQTAMKLDTQVKLSGTEALTPPVEPKGRAEEGRSFEQ